MGTIPRFSPVIPLLFRWLSFLRSLFGWIYPVRSIRPDLSDPIEVESLRPNKERAFIGAVSPRWEVGNERGNSGSTSRQCHHFGCQGPVGLRGRERQGSGHDYGFAKPGPKADSA